MPEALEPSATARMQQAAHEFAGQSSDALLEPEARFARQVVRLINDRLRKWTGTPDPDSAAIFILAPGHPAPERFTRIPFLTYQKATLTGRIWITNEVVAYGEYADHVGDDAELERAVVNELGLGDNAAIVYDPVSVGAELRFYPGGLRDPDSMTATTLSPALVTAAEIKVRIDKLRSGVLLRPGLINGQASPWADAARRHASSGAEAAIQVHVQSGLSFHFHECEVKAESNVAHGRLDILVEQYIDALDTWKAHCIIELKVLRSLNESGNTVAPSVNRDAITKGVLQAYKYRTDAKATWSALYCFDLRSQDSGDTACFSHISARAAAWNVVLERWFLYGSAEEARLASVA